MMKLKTGITAMWLGTALLLCGCAGSKPSAPRPRPVHLRGSVQGNTYVSAEGGFSAPFPVTPELNGRIWSDTSRSVTFTDDWGSRITFAGQPILPHSPIELMMQKEGREKALDEFARRTYGGMIVVHYHPEICDGMISFVYLRPASPKTAVAVFIRGLRIFGVETDTLPGVRLLEQSDEKSQREQDARLEASAIALAQTIEAK